MLGEGVNFSGGGEAWLGELTNSINRVASHLPFIHLGVQGSAT